MQKLNSDKGVYFISFLKQKVYLWIFFATIILFTGIYCFSLINSRFLIFPINKAMKYAYFTDSDVGGKSQVNYYNVSDTDICVAFTLKEGFVNPYVGIDICPKDNQSFDISAFNELKFEIEGKGIKNLLVAVITQNKNGIKTINDFYLNRIIEISEHKQLYQIKFDHFKLPDWWFYVNNISPGKELEPDFQNVLRINFVNGSTEIDDTMRSLRIHSVAFVRNNNFLMLILGLTLLCIILILFLHHFFKTKLLNKATISSQPLIITYKPVNAGEESIQESIYMDYIHSNFSNSNLSLELVAEQTGVNARRIAHSVMQQFGCNFKTYINQIRITEAKRLLKETHLNISEVAFKVGFNSPNHFNRVFKSMVGKSPTEFLSNRK